ncbi:inovirus-type Gp2 protein [Vibrio cyclitrophicus]
MNLGYFDHSWLVHFPDNPFYELSANDPNLHLAYVDCFYRLSYLAKANTKTYLHHQRSFGGNLK